MKGKYWSKFILTILKDSESYTVGATVSERYSMEESESRAFPEGNGGEVSAPLFPVF